MTQPNTQMKSKMSDVKLPVLRADNYSEWKIKITSLLKAKDLYDLCSEKPNEEVKDSYKYKLENEEAKTVIYSSLDTKTTQSTGSCEDAYDLWSKVCSYYEGSKDDLTGLALSRFMEISIQTGEKVSDFCGRFEIALTNLQATKFVIDMTLIVYVLCKSLPVRIKEGIKVWRTINKTGTTNELLSYIRANYSDENARSEANNSAFYANNNGWKNKSKPP